MTTTDATVRRPSAWSAAELAVMAVVAAVFGVISLFNQAITDVARIVLGFYAAMVFSGLFLVPGLLAYALIGRRGAAFVTQNAYGVVQVLLGNPVGVIVLWFTFAQALAQELALLPFGRSGRDRPIVWAVGGIAGAFAAQVPNYIFFGLGDLTLWAWLGPFLAVGLPSSVLVPWLIIRATRASLPANLRHLLLRD